MHAYGYADGAKVEDGCRAAPGLWPISCMARKHHVGEQAEASVETTQEGKAIVNNVPGSG